MTGLRILRAGPLCTVQDAGRLGWQRYGVTPAGPMDWIGHAEAGLLAGQGVGAAVEIGPGGIEVQAQDAALRVGLSARGFAVTRDGAGMPDCGALMLGPGQVLRVVPGVSHVWGYLAVAGGFALAPVMGSLATHLRSGIGPFDGRALQAGDVLPCTAGPPGPDLGLALPRPLPGVLRYVPGPQAEAFTDAARSMFDAERFTLSPRSDRMAYRLEGPRLTHARGHDVLSEPIAPGGVQVPGDGVPLVLMADRQPTGGYPRIGTVIRADLAALAQMRPGSAVRFRPVTVEEAVTALRLATPEAEAIRAACRTAGLDLEALASGNHAGGMVDARDPG
ncbi:MAG: biotin-dependent carboxyltransferase family protein [Gemmobacter sp.]